jgi:glycosyltransferase involved in cell wall biosynthesis
MATIPGNSPMGEPTVSVILPVYNGENYLRIAIDSVLAQTQPGVELLVVDDGSRDSTPEIARSYGNRLRYVRQDNTGVAGAFNHGLRLARGRYVSWLSHDDRFLPTKLERQVAALERVGTPAVCYTDLQIIDARGEVMSEETLPEPLPNELVRQVLTGGPILSASYSVVYDRRCVDEVGGYDASWRYTQDAEMLLRLARRFPLVRVPGALMQVREHDRRGVRSKNWEREVVRFFHEKLDETPLAELFPELGPEPAKRERLWAQRWLADVLASRALPLCLAAYPRYLRLLRENPGVGVRALLGIARLTRTHLRARLGRGSR